MTTPELEADELQVLKLLLDFHAGNDEPNEYYPDEPFKRLCAKFGVAVPGEYMQPEPDWNPSRDTAEEYDASFEE